MDGGLERHCAGGGNNHITALKHSLHPVGDYLNGHPAGMF